MGFHIAQRSRLPTTRRRTRMQYSAVPAVALCCLIFLSPPICSRPFPPSPKGSSSPVLLIRIADVSLSFYFFLSALSLSLSFSHIVSLVAFGFSSISLPPESSPLRPFVPRSLAFPSPASFASPPSSWTSEEAGAADAVYRLRGSRECVQRCNYCKLPPRRERAFPARKFHTADTGS